MYLVFKKKKEIIVSEKKDQDGLDEMGMSEEKNPSDWEENECDGCGAVLCNIELTEANGVGDNDGLFYCRYCFQTEQRYLDDGTYKHLNRMLNVFEHAMIKHIHY